MYKVEKVCGFQQLATLSSSIGLTIVNGDDGTVPNAVLLSAETNSVRYRADGTAPTASVGMRIIKDQQPYLYTGDLKKLAFIEETASAKLNVEYVRVVTL